MTSCVRPLRVGVDVHFDDTIGDSGCNLLLRRARSAVEDQKQRLRVLRLSMLSGKGLVFLKELRMKFDVSWLVHAVYVSESGCDGEIGRNRTQSLVHVKDIVWLSVERSVVDARVVPVGVIYCETSQYDNRV